MPAVIYTRVSSREQAEEGYSLAAQRDACMRLVADRGWMLAGEFCDAGESGRTTDRPQFQAMLDLLKQDQSIRYLVVHKLDRLARNIEDHVMVKATLRKHKVALVSATENFEDSASGQMVEGIMAVLAQFYSANLAQEVKKGLRAKLESGGWPHMAPLGYVNQRREAAGRSEAIVIRDESQAHLVRQAFELYSTGQYTLDRLHTEMTKRGLRNKRGGIIARSKLAELLHNKFYVGAMVWQGVEYPGNHEPIVSRELFNRVQEQMSSNTTPGSRERKHSHHLRGTIYCDSCGARMTTLFAKGRGGIYQYFFCIGRAQKRTNCAQKYVDVATVEDQIANALERVDFDSMDKDRIRKGLRDEIVVLSRDSESSTKLWKKRLHQLANERKKVMDAYLASAITVEDLKQHQSRINSETGYGEGQLALAKIKSEQVVELIDRAVDVIDRIPSAYRAASPGLRRKFNAALLKAAFLKDRQVVRLEFQELFAPLLSKGSNKTSLVGKGGFEPPASTSRTWRANQAALLPVRSLYEGHFGRRFSHSF